VHDGVRIALFDEEWVFASGDVTTRARAMLG
jgi:hypothetical protein